MSAARAASMHDQALRQLVETHWLKNSLTLLQVDLPEAVSKLKYLLLNKRMEHFSFVFFSRNIKGNLMTMVMRDCCYDTLNMGLRY